MLVHEAKEVARRWAVKEASGWPGFHGAYLAGSVSAMPADAELPQTSDIDLNVVFADGNRPPRTGKFVWGGVVLEVTVLSPEQLRSPERVLGDYHLAGPFRTWSVLLDPSGHLAALQTAVSRDFAKREWVVRRCRHARDRIVEQHRAIRAEAPLHDRIIGWVFPTGVTTHVLLTAGLQNPTVRRRYAAVRELLAERRELAFYERLLGLLGCAGVSRARVAHHLAEMTAAFDAAKAVVQTPFPFASDLSNAARPIAVDGSRELIERGLHREAVFWITVTFSRCRKALWTDAPTAWTPRFDAAYGALLADLGVASFPESRDRRRRVEAFLPDLWEAAKRIIADHPGIET